MPMCISLSTTIPRARATCAWDRRSASTAAKAASSTGRTAGTKRATLDLHRGLLTSRPAGEGKANDFAVVADDDMAVRVGRGGPRHVGKLPAPNVRVRWRDQVGAADLLETLRREPRHHELAAVIVDEVPIAVAHEEGCAIHGVLLEERVRFPHELAGRDRQAAELAVVVDAVQIL